METLSNNKSYRQYILIVMGAVLMAVSVNMVYEPMDMVTGGITGIAIVVKHFSGKLWGTSIPIWVTNTLLNLPLFIIAVVLIGKKFIRKTLFATVCFTVALYIIPETPIMYGDMLLASVFGGVAGGAGLGLIFATASSTGGTDLLGIILNKYLKHYSISQLILVIDGAVVIIGAVVFGVNKSLYAVIAVFITSKVIDSILEGMKFAKLAYIISDKYEDIAQEILEDMDRGVTGIFVRGMYTRTDKKMLFCVVSKKEIILLIDIVAKKDPKAFIIVSDVREVMGEGFIEYRQ